MTAMHLSLCVACCEDTCRIIELCIRQHRGLHRLVIGHMPAVCSEGAQQRVVAEGVEGVAAAAAAAAAQRAGEACAAKCATAPQGSVGSLLLRRCWRPALRRKHLHLRHLLLLLLRLQSRRPRRGLLRQARQTRLRRRLLLLLLLLLQQTRVLLQLQWRKSRGCDGPAGLAVKGAKGHRG